MRAGLAVLPATILGAAVACAPAPVEAAVLELREFHQSGAAGVFLNEALVFHFSAPVDRSSVHPESLRVRGPRGRPVAGSFDVEGSTVLFHPRLATRPDLTDGGLQLGTVYTVELLGFPFPDGLRGRGGEPLSGCRQHTFSTAAAGSEVVFAPPLDAGPGYLVVEHELIGPLDPIRLQVNQPIDPRSVARPAFDLLDSPPSAEPSAAKAGEAPREAVSLPLRVTLVENRRDGALLELRPLGAGDETLRALEPGAWYVLRLIDGAAPPRNLAGIPVEPAWSASRLGGARISVQGRGRAPVAGDLWSLQPVPGVDGTADWSGGRVAIRYPRAAGSGADGEVLLHELAEPRDVHATRLKLPASETALLPAEGLVVLRSQGRMDLAGALRRPPPAEPAPPMVFPAGQTLSEWLEEARARDPAWTVLIAGGDLTVPALGVGDAGGIELAGPLLLVSGGRLRIGDDLRAEALWKLSPGDVARRSQPELLWVKSAIDPRLKPSKRFRVDEPTVNPLLEPLDFAVLSASFRPESGIATWPGGWEIHNGRGSVRLRWLGQRYARDQVEELGPVDDVLLLEGSDALRLRLDLTVPPAPHGLIEGVRHIPLAGPAAAARLAAWDPPAVDSRRIREGAAAPGAEER